MRIDPVVVGRDANLQEMLDFFMGKNTPDRQKFIIDNLRVEKDDAIKADDAADDAPVSASDAAGQVEESSTESVEQA